VKARIACRRPVVAADLGLALVGDRSAGRARDGRVLAGLNGWWAALPRGMRAVLRGSR